MCISYVSIFAVTAKETQMKTIFALATLFIAVSASAHGSGSITPDALAAASPAHKQQLDHGPRATSTPWLNKKLREHESANRAAAQTSGKAPVTQANKGDAD